PARLQACPPASLEPGIEHLLANSPAGIFCDSGLLEQPSVQQESLSNPLPKAAVVAEEADSAAPTTMPVPLSNRRRCYSAIPIVSARDLGSEAIGYSGRFQSASDWCRAIVTKLNIESAVCDVFFPDYGNSVSNKQIAELLTMPPALCEIPPLAHRISLNNIAPRVMNNGPTSQQQPDQWSTEAVYELQEILVKKCFTGDLIVRIVSQQPGETLVDLLIRVVLHDCDLRFLSCLPILACYAMPYLHNREASNDLVDTEAPRLFLRSSNIFKVIDSWQRFGILFADEFYVFALPTRAPIWTCFERCSRLCSRFCNEDKIGDYTVQHPVANLPVAARYSVDCNWYRGSHVFNFLCMDTPSTVDPNSDGLPTVPVGVYELNTPVCLNVRLYDEGVYSDMPADALARLVKEAPVPICPFKREHGRGNGAAASQPATRGSRVKAAARASANSTTSDSNVSDSRSSTPAAPRRQWNVEPISENYQLLEPWLAKLVLTGKLDHAACTVTSIVNPGLFYIRPENDIGRAAATELNHLLARFSPRNNNSAPRPLPPDAPPTVLACVRKPNLLWYRCRLLQRSSTADTCTVLLIDSGEEYNTPANAIFEITDNQLASLCRPCCALPPVRRYSGRRPALDSHLRRGDAQRPQQRLPMQRASQQRLAVCRPVAVQQRWPVQSRLSSMLRLEGVALRHVEPVPPEAAYQRLAEAKLLRKKRDENLRLRDAEAAATADALKSFKFSRTDAAPSDEDGDWVNWRPVASVCRCRSSSSRRAATEDSSASTSTSFICLAVRPLATNSVGQIFKSDRCESQSKLSLSHLDCSDERMRGASDAELRHALHTVYSAVSYAQYDFDVLVEDWARRSVVFESDGVWCRGRVLNYVREQGLFFLLDIDTGYSKIREHFDITRSATGGPYQKTIGALLTSSAKLNAFTLCTQSILSGHQFELLLASIVLLPDNREISQELIDGLPWLESDQKLFKMAYRSAL
uniref:Tudor domain-containing protein n=1 Tax=Macrostomum lignano TaxID=282301 RepID=A0A1I8F9V1_9PLAT